MTTPAAQVRQRLSHPVIDADGHWLEVFPVFLEFLAEAAGAAIVDTFVTGIRREGLPKWYGMSDKERAATRFMRPPAWAFPARPAMRTPSMLPGLYYDSLDRWGIDVALIYPSMGLTFPGTRDPELRCALVRAYNDMVAELFAPYADRILPAAICTMNTPEEAMAEARRARSLGLRLLMINGTVPRALDVDAKWQADPRKRRIYIDCLGLDSPYDYDPVWRTFAEVGMAPTNHAGSIGWPDRCSPSNFVANHLGHFAQGNHLFARGLFLGGVTRRFADLNFGFLEGGVGWACGLYADLCGHWKKRNAAFVEAWCKPTLLDRDEVRRDLEKYARRDKRFQGKVERILDGNLDCLEPDTSQEVLTARDLGFDEFAQARIGGVQDIAPLFCGNFYFGCEADDPATAWAFAAPFRNAGIKPVFGSDISHFDVENPEKVLAEAWEQVEEGCLDEADFRQFCYANAVALHTRGNPDFFAGTVVEAQVAAELGRAGGGRPGMTAKR